MAACDNLYGNLEKWEELNIFLTEKKPEYLKYMYKKPNFGQEVRICYVADIQDWLIKNYPKSWLKQELEENFSVQRMILGKAHHEKKIIRNKC